MTFDADDIAVFERIADALDRIADSVASRVIQESYRAVLLEERVAQQRAEAAAHQVLVDAARAAKAAKAGAP